MNGIVFGMVCEACKRRPADVHISTPDKGEHHFCPRCAEQFFEAHPVKAGFDEGRKLERITFFGLAAASLGFNYVRCQRYLGSGVEEAAMCLSLGGSVLLAINSFWLRKSDRHLAWIGFLTMVFVWFTFLFVPTLVE